jgi:hypothetical protein
LGRQKTHLKQLKGSKACRYIYRYSTCFLPLYLLNLLLKARGESCNFFHILMWSFLGYPPLSDFCNFYCNSLISWFLFLVINDFSEACNVYVI